MSRAFAAFLDEAVAKGVSCGLAVSIGSSQETFYEDGHGTLALGESTRVTAATLFDVASLTKVMVTATLVAQAVDEKKLSLEQCVGPFLLRHLLCHASGLPAWKPYYEKLAAGASSAQAKRLYRDWILEEPLETEPGERACYSDLGFMFLGFWLEDIFADDLSRLAQVRVFDVLRMKSTAYGPVDKTKVAATEHCPVRHRVLRGEVHDLNAFALGGAAGHAGIFSSVHDVGLFAKAILRNLTGQVLVAKPETLRQFAQKQHLPPDSTWALAWDTPSAKYSSAGGKWPRDGIGHLGFTGCSIWLDPTHDFYVTCLSNRVHPDVQNEKIKVFRPTLHDEAVTLFRKG